MRLQLRSFFTKRIQSFSRLAGLKKVVVGKIGFTLIELLVSVAIIAIITAIVIFNQNDLSEQISLTNVVSDIGLQVRQAQVYGISVKEFNPSASQFSFSTAYGVDFNLVNALCPLNNGCGFYTFADLNQDGYFDTVCPPSATSECIAWNFITRGNSISKLCVIKSDRTSDCSPTIGRVAITFLRPNPTAQIVFFNGSGTILSYLGYQGATIEIKSPHNMKKTIFIYTTGQISIQ